MGINFGIRNALPSRPTAAIPDSRFVCELYAIFFERVKFELPTGNAMELANRFDSLREQPENFNRRQ